MTEQWITFEQVFDGQRLLPNASVRIEHGHVVEVSEMARGPKLGHCLTPGFLDLQVNGGGGAQLNSTPTPEAMRQIASAHRRFGTVRILPTVITDQPSVLEQAAEAALRADDQLGLHIEGPHLKESRRGTHKADHIRPFDPRTLDIVSTLRQAGRVVMITVAPDVVSTHEVTALAQTGAIVSLGHTDATAEQIEDAVTAGACCATHLFNAMSPMTSRAPGAVGGILNSDIPFGIICDGFHVDDRMVRLALRAAGPDRAFLVSDAMATVGGGDHFELYGEPVHLRDGRLVNREGGLAGAHITQAQGVERLVHHVGLPLQQALRMAVATPARVIARPELARLAGRPLNEVLRLDKDLSVLGDLSTAPLAHA